MKKFERIFLYSMLAILFFYVFLVDGNVQSQGVIQEEIRARSIVIVNDEGREVVKLSTDANNNGGVVIYKDGNIVAIVGASEKGGVISVANKFSTPVIGILAGENGGTLAVSNKDGNIVALTSATPYGGTMDVRDKDGFPLVIMAVTNYDRGEVMVYKKDGKMVGNLP